MIEKRATNTNEKMLYLLQYLLGPPKKIVEGYQFVPTGDAYDFYVDDGLKSVPSVKTAIDLIRNTQAMCAKAGLRLHKFSSNKKEVIQAVAPEDRAKGLQELDLACDPLPIERTLGIMWCAESDTFQFRIIIQDRPLTRRGILSTLCSIYDPLGFVAPLILMGKQILQDLCRCNADWDDPIGEQLRPKLKWWQNELHELEKLKIPRCYKPEGFGEIKAVEVHHFSDTSLAGHGQCSYLRLLNKDNQAYCSFLMGKARVAPLKFITVPRLELQAAVVSIKISQWLLKELDYQDVSEFFWTDSRVVIGCINNETKHFHTFVAIAFSRFMITPALKSGSTLNQSRIQPIAPLEALQLISL